MRHRRAQHAAKPEFVREMLAAGRDHARKLGGETIEKAHEAMGMNYKL